MLIDLRFWFTKARKPKHVMARVQMSAALTQTRKPVSAGLRVCGDSQNPQTSKVLDINPVGPKKKTINTL